MKIDPKILSGGDLDPCWSDEYKRGALEGLKFMLKFPRVSERRAALLDAEGEAKGEDTVRAFYFAQVTDWNVEDSSGAAIEFDQDKLAALVDLDAGLEGFIVREVQELARFL